VLATSLVNRLLAAHEKAADLKSYSNAGAVIRGVAVMSGMLAILSGFFPAHGFVFAAAILAGLIYTALSLWGLTLSGRMAEAEIANAAKGLSTSFPELVAENGGQAALRNPESVELLRHRLTRPSGQSSTRTSVLGSLVARLEQAHASLDALDGWPMWVSIVWGFFPALLLGWLSGEIAFSFRNDTPFPAAFGVYGNDWTANLVGFVVGVIIWIGYVRLIRVYKRPSEAHLQRRVRAFVTELSRDFPREVESVGGSAALDSLSTIKRMRDDLAIPTGPPTSTAGLTVAQLETEPQRRLMAAARFKDVLLVRSAVENNVGGTWAGLVFLWIGTGLATGILAYQASLPPRYSSTVKVPVQPSQILYVIGAIVLGIFLAWLIWEWMTAIRRGQERRWACAVDEFTNQYPKLVAEWGGRQAFDNPETSAAILRALEPESASNKGFLARVLGG
jgi:hypothetical protein